MTRFTARTRAFSIATVAALAALASCSTPPAVYTPVKITSFTVTPSVVAAGGDVVLAWAIEGDIDRIELFQGATTLAEQSDPVGSLTITGLAPGRNEFSLVVSGRAANQVRAEAVAEAVSSPTIGKFVADRTSVAGGTAVILSWETALADTVVISANGATVGTRTGAEAAQGALLVKPVASTEYKITATGLGSPAAEKKLTVTVIPAPVISSVTATPTRPRSGETVTLRWSTAGATSLQIRIGNTPVYTAEAANLAEGSKAFTIDQATVYTFVVNGPGGEATSNLTVNVIQNARVANFSAEPADLVVGESTTLTWELVGVDAVTLKANGVDVALDSTAPAGLLEVSPTETTVYTIAGSGEGGSTTADLLVNVYGVPTIAAFTTDKGTIFRRRDPAHLSWQTSNCNVLSIADASGDLVDLLNQPVAAGSVPVAPNLSTDYTLTCVGPGGVVQSAPLHITVSEPPPSITGALAKTTILDGESTNLTWRVLDYDTFVILANGVPVDLTGKNLGEDVLAVRPSNLTTYTLRAHSAQGGDTELTLTLNVVKPPKFLTFTAGGSRALKVTRGKTYSVEWTTSDATSVLFEPADGQGDSPAYESIANLPGTVPVTLTNAASSSFLPGDVGTAVIPFPDGFRFPYGASTYSSVQMNANGYLCFGAIGTGAPCTDLSADSNQTIPSTSKPDNLIAVFWDDLEGWPDTVLSYRIDGTEPNRSMTFEWKDTDFYTSSSTRQESLTFKAVLHESGLWEIWNAPRPPSATATSKTRFGTSATIGVEDATGATALKIAANDANGAGLCRVLSGTGPYTCDPITRWRPRVLSANGTTTVIATESAILRMKAFGPLGTANSDDLVITVVDPAVVNAFAVSRAHIGANESVNLDWSVGPNASVVKRVTIRAGATTVLELINPTILSGSFPVTPTADTTYTIEVVNDAGDKDVKTADVKVAVPVATLVADRTDGAVGDRFKFTWTSVGATTLVLKDPSGAAIAGPFAYPADKTVMAGSFKADVAVAATGDYTLEATNGSGPTIVPVHITIATDLQMVKLSADPFPTVAGQGKEQTAGKQALLTWENFNAKTLTVEIVGEATALTVPALSDLNLIRNGNYLVPVRATDTTYRVTITGDAGTTPISREVTITSVPAATIQIAASPASISWNQDTTITWSTTNAVGLKLYELVGSGSGAVLGAEIAAARDRPNGTYTARLFKSTGYRIVATNRLGTETQKDLDPVQVSVAPPSMQLTVSPDAAPKGGFFNLSWSSSQAEKVYLWQRDPPTATGVASTTGSDPVQIPYDYVPFDFVDISSTGTPVTLSTGTTTQVVNPHDGYAIVPFPAGFTPHFLGEDQGKMLISAEGVVLLAPAAAADTYFDACRSSTCTSNQTIVASSSTTVASNRIAPFWAPLSACAGYTTSSPYACPASKTAGKVFYQLRGTAPNRMMIVQWDRWDSSSTTNQGTFTFQTKIFENGDVEFQYKTLNSATASFAKGGGAVIGVEKKFYAGTGVNYFLSLANNSANLNLTAGDGYRIYSGTQAPTGTVRTFFNTQTSSTTAPKVLFRGVSINSGAAPNRAVDLKSLDVLAGVNDILINELMIDPADGDDTDMEWIELRNTTTKIVPLKGYTLQTSSGSFTFTGGEIPARVGTTDGYLVVGQSAVMSDNGGVPIALAYGNTMKMNDLADSVILRYGNILIDRVEYDNSGGWRVPSAQSLSFDIGGNTALANDVPSSWCGGRVSNNPGARSSPGAANGACRFFGAVAYDPTTRLEGQTGPLPGVDTLFVYSSSLSMDLCYNSTALPIGFTPNYFGSPVTQMGVSCNGFMLFGGLTGAADGNVDLTTATTSTAPDGLYPLWDDLTASTTTRTPPVAIYRQVQGTAPNRRLVVQWAGFRQYSSTCSGTLDFSIALSEDGTVEYHYHPPSGVLAGTAGCAAAGSGGTVGLRAQAGGLTVQYLYSSSPSTTPTPALPAIPTGLRYQVTQ